MRTTKSDEALVRRAMDIGRRAVSWGDIPIGALVVSETGQILAEAANRREVNCDPTAHAEVLALRSAAREAGSWRLSGATLVVSMEPCPMCAGAAVNARVARILFGAWNPDYGACGSVWDLPRDRRLNHRPEVIGGLLADEAGMLVSSFFSQARDTRTGPGSSTSE